MRLGASARVRDIDPSGRLALVSHWRRPLRVLDLRQLVWLGAELPRGLLALTRAFPPRLTSDHRLVHPMISSVSEEIFIALLSRSLNNGAVVELPHGGRPVGSTSVSAYGDVYSYVNDEQKVVVVTSSNGDAGCSVYEPLPRKVVQAVCIDSERDLLASASWSEIALHRMRGGTLERLGYTQTERPGDVRWIGIAGNVIAAAVHDNSYGTYVEVRRILDDFTVGLVTARLSPTWGFRAAALSADGRYLAGAFNNKLTVLDIVTGLTTEFDEHTDAINAVRFARDHVLVSADTDNRLILRPRTDRGYDVPLIPGQVR